MIMKYDYHLCFVVLVTLGLCVILVHPPTAIYIMMVQPQALQRADGQLFVGSQV